VHARPAAEKRPIAHRHVTAEQNGVRHHHVIANLRIVRGVAVCHEEAAVADARCVLDPVVRSAMHRYALANHALVADDQP
jgi:hypothetical protein